MEAYKIQKLRLTDDKEIAKRVLQGENALFEILMRRYNQMLYRVIRGYLSHHEDVEDVMQETYLKAFQKLQQFRGASSFSTWLIRIGINEALMRLRNTAKQQRSLHDLFTDSSIENKIVQFSDGPERKIIQNEMQLILEKAVDKLPEKYRVVYIMKEVEDMDFAEIADCLDITENNVKVRLHRAKNLLKEELYNLSSGAEIYNFGSHRCDNLVSNVMERI